MSGRVFFGKLLEMVFLFVFTLGFMKVFSYVPEAYKWPAIAVIAIAVACLAAARGRK